MENVRVSARSPAAADVLKLVSINRPQKTKHKSEKKPCRPDRQGRVPSEATQGHHLVSSQRRRAGSALWQLLVMTRLSRRVGLIHQARSAAETGHIYHTKPVVNDSCQNTLPHTLLRRVIGEYGNSNMLVPSKSPRWSIGILCLY